MHTPTGCSRRTFVAAAAPLWSACTPSASAAPALPSGAAAAPLVLGHRGACALRPEHTLASYAQAIADGADFIEPDLVTTRDGVLVARHENNIAETTDVARHPEFAGRRTVKTVDGTAQAGWFVEDFTLAELKTLRAIERLPLVRPANTRDDGRFQVPTFEEIIDFVSAESAIRGRLVGLVPELKHSTYFAACGLPLEAGFLQVLAAHEYTRRAPLEIQSFEVGNLKALRAALGRREGLRLMQLVDTAGERPADAVAAGNALTYGQMTSPAGLRDIARYADVVAPQHRAVIPLDADGRLAAPTSLVADAHAAGLDVHTWTFRPENRYLAAEFRDAAGDNARNPRGSVAEIRRYLAAGIDGFFTDDPAVGRLAVDGRTR